MKQIGIITIIDLNNYGNRLQNYALSYYCNKKLNVDAYTLRNDWYTNNKNKLIYNYLKIYFKKCKKIIKKIIGKNVNIKNKNRKKMFEMFDNENMKYYEKKVNINSNLERFDYFIVGSDQVWNPKYNRLSDLEVLKKVDKNKRISYAASFGINNIEEKYYKQIHEISKFKALSVREEQGKKIIKNITNRQDIEVLVDPTMLLTADEWDKVSKKPSQLKSKKYILNYFLGELSEKRKSAINKIAKENNCDIINIMDKDDPFNECGPSEFLYLEKNAFLICTDSFHSSVFAIIYDIPFVIFDRESKDEKMNSRIETLLTKLNINNRKYNEKEITKENIEHDYSEAFRILEEEKQKSREFLEKALDIKGRD